MNNDIKILDSRFSVFSKETNVDKQINKVSEIINTLESKVNSENPEAYAKII